jgi:hypothetical protein
MTINPSGNVAMTGDLTVTGTIAGGSTTFPTTLDSGTMPAIEALQAKVGVDSSAVATSHDYKIDALESDVSTLQSNVSTNTSNIGTNTTDISNLETDVTNINELQRAVQSSTSYTLVLADAGTLVEMSNASANTLTIPPDSSLAFPNGTQILVVQAGSGQTTLVAGSGVTIRSKDGNLKLSAQWCGVTLIKRAPNNWLALGDLSA